MNKVRFGYESYDPEEYWMIPQSTMAAMRRHVEDGQPTGDFMAAVLKNDLRETMGRADERNTRAIRMIVQFLYNNAPGDSWGSPENVKQWIKRGGTNGRKSTSNG